MKTAALLAATAAGAMTVAQVADAYPEFGRKKEGDNPPAPEDLTKLVADATDKLKQVQDFAAKAAETLRKGEELTAEQTAKIDPLLTDFNDMKARLADMEQKGLRGGDTMDPVSAGQTLIDAGKFKSFAEDRSGPGRVTIEVKDITTLTTNAPGSAGALLQSERRGLVVELPQRRMSIRALIAPGTTSASLIEYDREKVFTNNADMVAEGVAKPQSELQFEDASAPVRKIAHWFRMSAEILADAPALRSVVDQRLRYGLSFKEEQQLLNGSGAGQNLSGLVTNATAYAAPAGVTASNLMDTIRYAILQIALAEFPANGVVLNPIDWAVMETLKDGQGRYLIGDPQGRATATLWGLPVVATPAMTEDKFLVGAFDLAAQIFDRQDATVTLSTEDQDNFIKNKVTILAEERLALAIYRPQSLVYGDLGRVA